MSRRRHLSLLTAVVAVLLAIPATSSAQNKNLEATSKGKDSLITDRPDFTESSATPPPGRLQLEAGLQYTHRDADPDDVNSLSAPNTLLRYGISDAAEFRLQVPNVVLRGLGDEEQETNFGEVTVGAKFATALSKKVRVGLIPSVGVGVENGDVSAELRGTGKYIITKNFSLASNIGARTYEGQSDTRYWEGFASLAAGYSLTNDLSTFIEAYSFFPEDADTRVYTDAGVLYLVTNYVQLDAYVGTKLTGTDEIFAGAGVSVLF